MSDIINIKNFNKYCGRYSRKSNPKTPEKEIGWYIYDSILQKIPVLAIRKRLEDDNWPLSWKKGRDINLAVDHTIKSLKSWQVFRPMKTKEIQKIEGDIKHDVPMMVMKFQKEVIDLQTYRIRDLNKLEQGEYEKLVILMSKIVGYLSSYKNNKYPMLGSKMMHFMFPEFFPVWDTAWIRNTALIYEDTSKKGLESWLSERVTKTLNKYEYAISSIKYAKYLGLMCRHLDYTGEKEYDNIEKAYIRYSEIPKQVIGWHFSDLIPIVFEVCLLGKYKV